MRRDELRRKIFLGGACAQAARAVSRCVAGRADGKDVCAAAKLVRRVCADDVGAAGQGRVNALVQAVEQACRLWAVLAEIRGRGVGSSLTVRASFHRQAVKRRWAAELSGIFFFLRIFF